MPWPWYDSVSGVSKVVTSWYNIAAHVADKVLELKPRYSNGTKHLPQGSPGSCPRSADRLIFEIRAGMEGRWKHGSGRRMTGDMLTVEAVGGAVVLD